MAPSHGRTSRAGRQRSRVRASAARPFARRFPGRVPCWEAVMLRVLLLALALTSQFPWSANAADVDWLCYTGANEPGDPAIQCLPEGGSAVAHPLAGWRGARRRDAARTVEVTNHLGRVSVRVRGAVRLLLAPAEGGATALACRSARARGAAHRRTRPAPSISTLTQSRKRN